MRLRHAIRLGRWTSAAVVLILAGCTKSADEAVEASTELFESADTASGAFGWVEAEEARAEFDEDAARDAAEDEIASEDYMSVGAPYGCSDDCSGHEAGFRYRADNGFVSYGAGGDSFREGGEAFEEAVEDRLEEMRAAYEDGEEPY